MRNLRSIFTSSFSGAPRVFASAQPSAIAWLIPDVWINAVYGVFAVWSTPHIGKKVLIGITPAITDRNSLPSPIFEIWRIWVVATGAHSHPCPIFRRGVIAVFCKTVFAQTTARHCVPVDQMLGNYFHRVAAVADAKKRRTASDIFAPFLGSKATKLLPDKINVFHRNHLLQMEI